MFKIIFIKSTTISNIQVYIPSNKLEYKHHKYRIYRLLIPQDIKVILLIIQNAAMNLLVWIMGEDLDNNRKIHL